MTEPTTMVLVYKIFKMKKYLLFLFLTCLTLFTKGQIIPIGTIIKTNKLHTVTISDDGNISNDNWPKFRLNGTIQQGGSKAEIVQSGFVIKEGYYGTYPDLQNARVVDVSSGLNNFSAIVTFPQPENANRGLGSLYSVRAFLLNSFGQASYSEEILVQVPYNYCEIDPCLNGSTCISSSLGPYCYCSVDFCSDCCSAPADVYCPGGGEYPCRYSTNELATNDSFKKNKYFNTLINQNTMITTINWAILAKKSP
jgi:hypothetical protein